jgi:hypothetical protein
LTARTYADAIRYVTDIVDATARASALGDPAWGELLGKHYDAVRAQLGSFRGREVDTAGDGFFATFDGPARAIRCACAIRDSVRALGLEIRAGLHTGECELVGGKATGIAVHLGARVAAQAEDGEVLVSGTVKDLVAGSGITFESRGVRELKGLGEWPLRSSAIGLIPAPSPPTRIPVPVRLRSRDSAVSDFEHASWRVFVVECAVAEIAQDDWEALAG